MDEGAFGNQGFLAIDPLPGANIPLVGFALLQVFKLVCATPTAGYSRPLPYIIAAVSEENIIAIRFFDPCPSELQGPLAAA